MQIQINLINKFIQIIRLLINCREYGFEIHFYLHIHVQLLTLRQRIYGSDRCSKPKNTYVCPLQRYNEFELLVTYIRQLGKREGGTHSHKSLVSYFYFRPMPRGPKDLQFLCYCPIKNLALLTCYSMHQKRTVRGDASNFQGPISRYMILLVVKCCCQTFGTYGGKSKI